MRHRDAIVGEYREKLVQQAVATVNGDGPLTYTNSLHVVALVMEVEALREKVAVAIQRQKDEREERLSLQKDLRREQQRRDFAMAAAGLDLETVDIGLITENAKAIPLLALRGD